MTPKQRNFYESSLSGSGLLGELIARLDAIPVESQEFKMNGKIADRVEGWVSQMDLAPKSCRRVLRDPGDRKPWDKVDLSHLKPGQCPF